MNSRIAESACDGPYSKLRGISEADIPQRDRARVPVGQDKVQKTLPSNKVYKDIALAQAKPFFIFKT